MSLFCGPDCQERKNQKSEALLLDAQTKAQAVAGLSQQSSDNSLVWIAGGAIVAVIIIVLIIVKMRRK